MRYIPALLCAFLLLGAANTASSQKRLTIIGSSTSTCAFGLNSVTECYVYKLDQYYNQQAPLDTAVNNGLTLGGTNCYNGMPSSYVSPYSAPYQPITNRNVTFAIDDQHPDVMIVNYPTNGYNVLRVDSILYCLRTIRDSANKRGVPCFVTTTQPRTDAGFNTSIMKAKLAELKDSILLQFGFFALDFYTGLIKADSSMLYDSGDNVHMNALGHDVMFQRVLAKNIFNATLPATFLQFNTVNKNNTNIITWSTAKETDVAFYEIQRSTDGRDFTKLATVKANNSYGNNQYQFTDDQPLKGWSYYKILIVDKDGKRHASAIMSVRINTGKLSLIKAFVRNASQVVVELQNNEPQNADLQIINSMGVVISKISRKIEAGSNTIYITTPVLANGVYYVRITSGKESMVGSFIKN
ncbi:MAG: T9SS type A sorting domain-containing protein [Chitinophagaceae bacterium]